MEAESLALSGGSAALFMCRVVNEAYSTGPDADLAVQALGWSMGSVFDREACCSTRIKDVSMQVGNSVGTFGAIGIGNAGAVAEIAGRRVGPQFEGGMAALRRLMSTQEVLRDISY